MGHFRSSLRALLGPTSSVDKDSELREGFLREETDVISPVASSHGARGTAMASRLVGVVKRVATALLPHPVARRLAPHLYKAPRTHATSYLDGLRGIASFAVFLYHYSNFVTPILPYYGVDTTDTRPSSPIQLPFIRAFYHGRPMVHVFFVISGFVLSRKPLKLARARNYSDLHAALSSSIYRRFLRLSLPVAGSTFISLLLIRAGWSQEQPVEGGFVAQVRDWMWEVYRITCWWPWEFFQRFRYDSHLWTIPGEISMSMLLFVTITGLSRCTSTTRLASTVVVMLYCFCSGHWAAVEFLGGAFIAEVDLIEDKRSHSPSCPESSALQPASSSTSLMVPKSPRWSGIAWAVFWYSQLAVALFICGWPNENVDKAPGLAWLAEHSPDPSNSWGSDLSVPWYVVASLQIVFACQQLPFLQRFLSTEPIQYLASISFALYLMHGPICEGFGARAMDSIWDMAGVPGGREGIREETAGPWQVFFVWTGGIVVLGGPIVWVADLFWRFVDRPSVEFARWVDGRWGGSGK